MLHIEDLFDINDFLDAKHDGYVRVRVHPVFPFSVANYTEAAVFEKNWNEVTLKCRGLIYNHNNGEIISRPFPKFFNYEEVAESLGDELDPDSTVQVTDKMDGSLGIVYLTPYGPRVATRGSFTSEQAVHASHKMADHMYYRWKPSTDYTLLTEIIYPENRIVVDYGRKDDLYLLGAVELHSGRILGPQEAQEVSGWPGPLTEILLDGSLEEALSLPLRDGKEGIVVRWTETDMMVKVKQDDYMALHKIVTGLNERGIWQLLGEGKTIKEICDPLPDEHHEWAKNVSKGLIAEKKAIKSKATREFNKIMKKFKHLEDGPDRKEFAEEAKNTDMPAYMFNLYDGVDIDEHVWKTLRPEGDTGIFSRSEDVL